MNGAGAELERRVLVVAPTRRDAETTRQRLGAAGVEVTVCRSLGALLDELALGAAAIMFPEEDITGTLSARLAAVVAQQPPWSDLPVLVLLRPGSNAAASAEAASRFGNVTLLERPLQVATLLSAVRTALRARDRQVQIRGYLAERARAEDSLRLADRRKDEFLATLGHELRNPLAPLVTGLHVLRAVRGSDPRDASVLALMHRQLDHLARLVDDLLEVSRITRGLVDIQRQPTDLVAVIRSAVETCRPLMNASAHTLVVDVPPEPVIVTGDAVRLTQVFTNLLTNAAKYTNAGGRVWLTVLRDGQEAVVTVRDNGIGIPVSHLGSVFEMFTQVDRSNRRSQGGLGIGLTLVRSLVQLHGGRVTATSQGLGMGSEFRVELPLTPTRIPVTPEPARVLPRFPSRRVLVVDDNRDAAEMLAALLESLGVTVSSVYSGVAALARLVEFAPDAVLLDIGMPGMDGFAVARAIRALPDGGSIQLIALTGWGQEQDVEQTRAAGFDHHLVKPPDLDVLARLLAEGRTQRAAR